MNVAFDHFAVDRLALEGSWIKAAICSRSLVGGRGSISRLKLGKDRHVFGSSWFEMRRGVVCRLGRVQYI